jgi:hypothetical protein
VNSFKNFVTLYSIWYPRIGAGARQKQEAVAEKQRQKQEAVAEKQRQKQAAKQKQEAVAARQEI